MSLLRLARLVRDLPCRARQAAGGRLAGRPRRCGWVTADTLTFGTPPQCLGRLGGAIDMRVSHTARWLNHNDSTTWHELYRATRDYDVVVFFKAMDERCQQEAARLRARGTRVVFDANVNYYDVWGEYDVPGTRPTEAQQRDAIAMTRDADLVVADSTYILGVASRHNPRAIHVPDNVDLEVFDGRRGSRTAGPLRLVWSGMSHKAVQLLTIVDVLRSLRQVELVIVSESPAALLPALAGALPCRFVPYSDRAYARTLRECDVVVSPKRLVNGYEMGHTEYKITLGMAMGLPAVASPQPSYVEAIGHAGGGIVAETADAWRDALERLASDVALRADLGGRARQTVEECYATPVVARRYQAALAGL